MAASERLGLVGLFAVYIALLAGRFDLARLSDALPSFDLRIVAVAVCGYLWCLWSAAERRYGWHARVGAGPLAAAFGAWTVWMALSAAWAPPDARADEHLVDLVLMAALVAMAWSFYSRLPARHRTTPWWWFYWTGLVYVLAAFAQGPDSLGRYSALGGGPNVFVRVVMLAVIAALFLAAHRGARWTLAAVPVLVAAGVLSGSRGGLLAFAVVILLAAVPLLRRMPRLVRRLTVVLALGVAALVLRMLLSERFRAVYDRFVVQTLQEGYSSGRDRIGGDAYALFLDSPVIGVGLDGYYGLAGRLYGGEYPHNLVLAVGAEAGMIGLVALLAALVLGAATVVRRGTDRVALFLGLGAAYFFVAGMFSGDYYDSRFFWVLLGWAAVEARLSRRGSPGLGSPGLESPRPDRDARAAEGPPVPLPTGHSRTAASTAARARAATTSRL